MGLVKAQRQRTAVASAHEGAYARAYRAWARSMKAPAAIAKLRQAIEHKLPAADAARALPWWDARDPHGPWGAWNASLSEAYALTMRASGTQARGDLRRAIAERMRRNSTSKSLAWEPAGPEDFDLAASIELITKARQPARSRAPEISVPISRYSVSWIKRSAADKLTAASNEQREIVRAAIARGYEKGQRPEQIAGAIARVIGLNDRQARAVENRRAAAFESTDDEDRADAIADRYAEEQVAYRASVIARNENHEAQEQGRLDEWREARDDGEISEDTKRKWVSMPASDRLCDICEELDGQVVGLDEPFYSEVLGEGLDGPGAHVLCRCTTVLEFDT